MEFKFHMGQSDKVLNITPNGSTMGQYPSVRYL
jgi:hypothetical protein